MGKRQFTLGWLKMDKANRFVWRKEGEGVFCESFGRWLYENFELPQKARQIELVVTGGEPAASGSLKVTLRKNDYGCWRRCPSGDIPHPVCLKMTGLFPSAKTGDKETVYVTLYYKD